MAKGTCSIDGCERPASSRTWCSTHYTRWRKYGDPHIVHSAAQPRTYCSICGQPAHGHDLHDRVMAKTLPGPNGCIIFTGSKNDKGYGGIHMDGRTQAAHRVVLAHHQGWQDGMFALHSCDNPSCVNVDHLRWGTPAENTADMLRRGRARKR